MVNIENFKTFALGVNYLREIEKAVTQRCSVKKGEFKVSQNSQEKTTQASNFIEKETLPEFFFCEFCEIFTSTFFHGRAPLAASEIGSLADRTKIRLFVDLAPGRSKLCYQQKFELCEPGHFARPHQYT